LHYTFLGTVDNHGNTEITETVIFVKCRECRDFAKMPCFWPKCWSFTFSQEYFVRSQHNLKFIVWIQHKNILPLLPKSVCFVTFWQNMWPWCHRSIFFSSWKPWV